MDNELDACGYTFCCEALDHKSWIDHVFVSMSLCPKFTAFEIIDGGCFDTIQACDGQPATQLTGHGLTTNDDKPRVSNDRLLTSTDR